MFPPNKFQGDTDGYFQDLQMSGSTPVVSELFFRAKERYLEASNLMRHEDELTDQLRGKFSIEVEPLIPIVSHIATRHRYLRPLSRQMLLGETDDQHTKRLFEDWRKFYLTVIPELIKTDDFTRSILHLAIFPRVPSARMHRQTVINVIDQAYIESSRLPITYP